MTYDPALLVALEGLFTVDTDGIDTIAHEPEIRAAAFRQFGEMSVDERAVYVAEGVRRGIVPDGIADRFSRWLAAKVPS